MNRIQLKLSCSDLISFFTLCLLQKGMKAFETPPMWWHALNSNSALSQKTASHHGSDVIIKEKTVPVFAEVFSVFI